MKGGVKMKLKKFESMDEGLHWLYEGENNETLSIICHKGSYGWKNGQFETMCSWLPDVQGRLTFQQVQNKINTLKRREKKHG